MVHLLPSVKVLEQKEGFLAASALFFLAACDRRVKSAIEKLPLAPVGAPLTVEIAGESGEGYELWVEKNAVRVAAEGPAGAFYAVQTLRQLFAQGEVPCLYIKDYPDFAYRGFYHDVTRGKVPTLESLKKLVDEMAYYKLNSLQIYIEHTYAFEECKELAARSGSLTAEEIKALEAYCEEHFIEFIPSIATFGHLHDLLEQEQYQHLRALKDFEEIPNFWHSRMRHHTIDPLNPESLEVIKSLIDQYMPLFKSDTFNICCDETFDLQHYPDAGKVYVEFVNQLIAYVKSKGKKVMMWADILHKYPETITDLPEDTLFLNWDYRPEIRVQRIEHFAALGRTQIVCPGTWTWSRLCERVAYEEKNIARMAEEGYQNGAVGVLNTNWGDWGNPCSVELAMYGLALGAEKAWTVATPIDGDFRRKVNAVLYRNEKGWEYLNRLSDLHAYMDWQNFAARYFNRRYGGDAGTPVARELMFILQRECRAYMEELSAQTWVNDEYRQEMLIAAEGLCLMAELTAKLDGYEMERTTDAQSWLAKYKEKWLAKNKPSELCNIEEMFMYCENL